jgi:hypothetical protein
VLAYPHSFIQQINTEALCLVTNMILLTLPDKNIIVATWM